VAKLAKKARLSVRKRRAGEVVAEIFMGDLGDGESDG
jgi:hypothetical protein